MVTFGVKHFAENDVSLARMIRRLEEKGATTKTMNNVATTT